MATSTAASTPSAPTASPPAASPAAPPVIATANPFHISRRSTCGAGGQPSAQPTTPVGSGGGPPAPAKRRFRPVPPSTPRRGSAGGACRGGGAMPPTEAPAGGVASSSARSSSSPSSSASSSSPPAAANKAGGGRRGGSLAAGMPPRSPPRSPRLTATSSSMPRMALTVKIPSDVGAVGQRVDGAAASSSSVSGDVPTRGAHGAAGSARDDPADEAADPDFCTSRFLLSSSLQLLERQAQQDAALLDLIPALHSLIAAAGTKGTPSVLTTVQGWVADQERRRAGLRGDSLAMCGWLRKVSSTVLTANKRRWVVLDGATLLYYADRAETDLKGILHLSGSRCHTVRSLVDLRGYHFEIVAASGSRKTKHLTVPAAGAGGGSGDGDAGVLSPPGPTVDDVEDGADGSPLNPMHASKRTYHWVAASAEERDRWMCALQQAAGLPRQEQVCRQWSRRFKSATSSADYLATLHTLATRQTPLAMSADWVRVQMAKVERGMVPDASPPKSRRAAAKHERQRDRASAAATALAISQRRRVGYTPGDRVSLDQLQRDVQRDRVCIEGHLLTATSVPEVVVSLASTIMRKLAEKGLAPRPGRHDGVSWSSGEEARIMEFAHDVLKCSSRTVTGGDAYDAVDLVFGNQDRVLLVPASSEAPPLDFMVDWEHTLQMESFAALASSGGSAVTTSALSSAMPEGGRHSRNPSDSSSVAAAGDSASDSGSNTNSPVASLSSVPAYLGVAAPSTPRRANAFAGAVASADGSSTPRAGSTASAKSASGSSSTPLRATASWHAGVSKLQLGGSPPPFTAAAATSGSSHSPSPVPPPPPTSAAASTAAPFTCDQGPVCVKVQTSMRYSIRSADMGDCDDGPPVPWGAVVATFSRMFNIAGASPPAVIELHVDMPGGRGNIPAAVTS